MWSLTFSPTLADLSLGRSHGPQLVLVADIEADCEKNGGSNRFHRESVKEPREARIRLLLRFAAHEFNQTIQTSTPITQQPVDEN